MSVARVLLIGDEERLLQTQAVVLSHFWEITLALSTWTELALARAVSGVNVVVLDHTVPQDERKRWVVAIRESSPEKIVVQMNAIDHGPRGGLDATVAVTSGPGALVSTIHGLLVEKGIGSKGWLSLESTLMDEISGPIQ